jgi:hypothetical protein
MSKSNETDGSKSSFSNYMNSNVSKYQFGNGIGGVVDGTTREE